MLNCIPVPATLVAVDGATDSRVARSVDSVVREHSIVFLVHFSFGNAPSIRRNGLIADEFA
jgi:hypothetical protein